jgi:F0F1-type ATP synthase assembly protein I
MPNDPATQPPSEQTELTRSLHRSSGSFELAFAPVIMALIGLWIDRTAGTVPVFTVTLAVLGGVGAGLSTYYSYRHAMSQLAEDPALSPARPAGQFHARRRDESNAVVLDAQAELPHGEVAS